jgi:hypothetical protein
LASGDGSPGGFHSLTILRPIISCLTSLQKNAKLSAVFLLEPKRLYKDFLQILHEWRSKRKIHVGKCRGNNHPELLTTLPPPSREADLVVSRSSTLERAQPLVVGTCCTRCSHYIEPASKFCGNCGEPATLDMRLNPNNWHAQTQAQVASNLANMQAENFYRTHQQSTPSFAAPNRKAKSVPPEIREEMNGIITHLVRERFFLILHYCIFLVTNLIGFAMAIKCYGEFIGDDVSKTMVALTPLLFINLLALLCLGPIKGTKREIGRLNDRMANLKMRLEFQGIL